MSRATEELRLLAAKREAANQAAAARQANEQAGWALVGSLAERLPLAPRSVHGGTAYANTPCHVAFKLEEAADIMAWRETVASLMQVSPPCPLMRFKDACLSYAPELTVRQQAIYDEDGAECAHIAPFIIRLDRVPDYPSRAEVIWFAVTTIGRVQVSVTIGGLHTGSEAVGFIQEAQYRGHITPSGRDGRILTGYVAKFPFRTYRTDRFWAAGASPNPTVAYWDLSCLPADCCSSDDGPFTLVNASSAFLQLTGAST